jgi:hypothetical protein
VSGPPTKAVSALNVVSLLLSGHRLVAVLLSSHNQRPPPVFLLESKNIDDTFNCDITK